MQDFDSYKFPVLVSLAIHLVIVLALFVNWGFSGEEKQVVVVPQHIVAKVVTQDPFAHQKKKALEDQRKKWNEERKRKADLERKKVADEKKRIAEKKRKAEAKRKAELAKKKAAEQKKKDDALALKRKKEAEKKKQDAAKKAKELAAKKEAEKKAKELAAKKEQKRKQELAELAELERLEAEQKKQEQLAREQKELEEIEALERQLAELEAQQRASEQQSQSRQQQDNEISRILAIIKEAVQQNWELPPGHDASLSVTLRLYFQPDGDLRRVETSKSSGDIAMDRSAEQAAWRMGSIYEIRDLDAATFQRIQKLNIEFSPEE
jgi:colicin import membrane protein